MPWLIALNKDRDTSVCGVGWRRRLDHDSTGVLFKLASNFVVYLRILAVIGIIRHVSMLACIVLVGLRLVSCAQICGLSLHIFDVTLRHQMPTLLHELILDFAHAIEKVVLSYFGYRLVDGLLVRLRKASARHAKLRYCTRYFYRIRQHVRR